eukprot:gene4021-4657_t
MLAVTYTLAYKPSIKQKNVDKQLSFNSQGTFKILQFTDLHFGEASWKDFLSNQIQEKILATEPDIDLVVMTGDSVSGYAWDGTEGWFLKNWINVVQPMVNAGVRWAFTLGNHDDQADLNRTQIIEVDSTYQLSLTKAGPSDIHGASNYYLPVNDDSGEPALILYFFDSNDNDCQGVTGWGCVYPDQVEWYRSVSSELTEKYGRVVPAMAFMHIPLPEYMDMWNFFPVNGSLMDTGVCCFSVNTGLFAAFKEMGDVKSVHCGHDHDNDFSGNFNGIELAYGRKTGMGAYGPPVGWLHGARVLEITAEPFSISTWMRFEDGTTQETGPTFHAPNRTQQWNTCCDTIGFVNQGIVSQCKQYESAFLISIGKEDNHH